VIQGRALDLKTLSFFAGLPVDEKYYWVSSLYTLLIPEARRRRLAAYFTPPHLAEYAIGQLSQAGVRPGKTAFLMRHQEGLHSCFPSPHASPRVRSGCHDFPQDTLRK
jgi:hypothetical protein